VVGDEVVVLGQRIGESLGVALFDSALLGLAAFLVSWSARIVRFSEVSPWGIVWRTAATALVVSFVYSFVRWPNAAPRWWTGGILIMVVASGFAALVGGMARLAGLGTDDRRSQ
jgi:hypothetical protein